MPSSKRGGTASAVLPVLLALSLSLVAGAVTLAQAAEDAVLPGSGIHFPGGFDPNTVGELKGVASGLDVSAGDGPVRFRLDSRGERYTVLAAPVWYWKKLGVELPDGTEVVVRGSKTLGSDLQLYVVAQEIRMAGSGRSWTIRNEDGHPAWRASRGEGARGRAPGSGFGASGSGFRRGPGNGGGAVGGRGGAGGGRR